MKNSILKTSFKSFFKGFFLIIGIFFAVLLIFIVLSIFSKPEDKKVSINILPDLKGNTKVLSLKTPVILQINVHGIIGKSIREEEVVEKLIESRKNFFKNNRVKAILVHINSPGGGVKDSDGIYRALISYKKQYNTPIYAYVDGMCASGAFYIAAAANKIYASPISTIGSLGVIIGPFFNVCQTLEKIGITSLTITNGKDKDTLNPFRKWTDSEDENIRKIGNYMYERFVNIISSKRNISKDLLKNTYGAKIFDPLKAEEIKYIDKANQNYKSALAALLKELKIKEEYQVVQIKSKKKWVQSLFESRLFSQKNINVKLLNIKNLNNKNYFSYLYYPSLK